MTITKKGKNMYDIIINGNKDKKEIYLLENGILVECIKEQKNIEGNIYLGKVQNVLPGMQAAFVNIGEDKNTFIHLKDILPKIDETKQKPATNVNIKEIIKPGMKILVQVKRAECNKKGARVSTHISITGKYAVIMPNTNIITVSQKIEEKEEITRLKQIITKLLPENTGAIIRTLAKDKKEEELKEDVENSIKKWNEIEKLSQKSKEVPSLIYESDNTISRILVDINSKQIGNIIVNNKATYEELIDIANKIKIDSQKIKLEKTYDEYNLEEQIEKIQNRKIWLKCGGFITIDKTEALTAIDVNSGKYVGNKNLEQTVFTVNKEATIEIAKQLKLRDIGGIIIIDYIDMTENENKEKIESILKEELKKDRSKTQVIGFTKLNLLEMTRKHIN